MGKKNQNQNQNTGGYRLVNKPKVQQVTQKLAKWLADMDPAPGDRPLSERRMQVYERFLDLSLFRPVTWAWTTCKETGGIYRVNGKHTSNLLAARKTIPEFYAVIEEYECDSLDDVARLYSTFDSSTQIRTAREIYISFAATVPELVDVPHSHVHLAVTGIMTGLQAGDKHGRGELESPAGRAELLLEYPDFVRWMSNLLSNPLKTSKHLRRAPVVGVMFNSWQKSKMDSEKFWTAVRDQTGENPQLPDRELAAFLSGNSLYSQRNGKDVVLPKKMYALAMRCWLAWCKGAKTVSMRYDPSKPIPVEK